jgi:flagellar motor switch protein FliG
MSHTPSIRKAAVLVASLDADTADLLLAQMPDEQADQVRRAVLDMGDIDPSEQRAVLDEFFRIGPLSSPADSGSLNLDEHLLAGSLSRPDEYVPAAPQISNHDRSTRAPFSFLHDASPESLLPLLEREHPQVVALVLAHLPPERAGHLLARLPANMQTDVVRRLVDLEETDPLVLRDVELAVEAWIEKRNPRQRMAGISAVSAILNASEAAARRQILHNLTVHNRPLAHKLTPPPRPQRRISFAQVCQFPLDDLLVVVRAAERRTAALALAGASAELVADLLDCLDADEAESLSRRMANLSPLRLVDIDRAQEDLADLASQLHAAGELSGTTPAHLTAVV